MLLLEVGGPVETGDDPQQSESIPDKTKNTQSVEITDLAEKKACA